MTSPVVELHFLLAGAVAGHVVERLVVHDLAVDEDVQAESGKKKILYRCIHKCHPQI